MDVFYSEIEGEVVSWLSPLTTGGGVDVVQLPQLQAEFERPFLKGRITIAYKSSDFGDVLNTNHIVQDEKIQIEVIIQSRLLRGSDGLHAMTEAVKRRLLGYRPTDCSKMYLVKNGFTDHNNEAALWSYSMIFETKYRIVEDAEYNTETELSEVFFEYNEELPAIPAVPFPGTFPQPPVINYKGDIAYWDGEVWRRLHPGEPGYVLATLGEGEVPEWVEPQSGPEGPAGADGETGRFFVSDTEPTTPTTGDVWYDSTAGNTYLRYDGFWVEHGTAYVAGSSISNFVFVTEKADLPPTVAGVITLEGGVTYFFTTVVDLTGDRLVCGLNTTILGGSSENCRIKSTGLIGTALITSQYSLPIRNITIEADVALDLNGDGVTTAIDWAGVNFTDTPTVGTISNYSNFIMLDSAFLNAGGLTFDGEIGTVGMISCLFDNYAGTTAFIIPATANITRRFRIVYSSFVTVTGSGEKSISLDPAATIATERYILKNNNFAGGAPDTYLEGVDHTSNKALFGENVGITNTAVNGQLYMQGNATVTTIGVQNTWYKVAGTTTPSSDNAKFLTSNNRLTCDALIVRKYLIHCTLSFTAGNANVCEFGFFDSKLSDIRTPSRTKATANAAGRAENVNLFCVVSMDQGDYLEIHCRNTSSQTNITVDQMNFVVTEIR